MAALCKPLIFLALISSVLPFSSPSFTINVVDLGAKPNGSTNSASTLHSAWSAACQSNGPSTIYIPRGRFLVGHVSLSGPCTSKKIIIKIDGTLVAPVDYDSLNENWIEFNHVQHVMILGGTLDGQGAALWACKESGRRCPPGATSLRLRDSHDVTISGLTLENSKLYHISINDCDAIMLQDLNILAPERSPNTDGIHIEGSSYVSITRTGIKTGDDCISVGPGTKHIWIHHVGCGSGHGISIGSLGKEYIEEGVRNITVTFTNFTSSDNGLRIKTWGRPSSGFVRDVRFVHAVMHNVRNPIIITQNYCPRHRNCPGMSSGVEISNITYNDIRGSSATPVAVELDCSPSVPCRSITFRDVTLTYMGGRVATRSSHVVGCRSVRSVVPPDCV